MFRIAPEDLGSNLYTKDLVHWDQWGPIDGQPTDSSNVEVPPKTWPHLKPMKANQGKNQETLKHKN